MAAADIDGDGDMDVLSASQRNNKIAWYENTDGQGAFGAQRVIHTDLGTLGAIFVAAADVDGDGDMDVLSASLLTNKIAWYENVDGQGGFGSQQVISTEVVGVKALAVADLDGDGDRDVLSASNSDNKIAWYENIDRLGTFGPQRVITTQAAIAESVAAADLDGDGDLDVLSASLSDNKIAWYANMDGMGTFGTQQVITTQAIVANWVAAADLDGDGDVDGVSASRDQIAWYQNRDGRGRFGPPQVITTQVRGAQRVVAADVDGDGDRDLLSASGVDGNIAWYENTDGRGTFGPQQVITRFTKGARSVAVGDLDGDGDLDVLSASYGDDKAAWYENTDGKGSFGPQRVISADANVSDSLAAADLDGDGDLDVLSALANLRGSKIVWYQNTDGQGRFGPQQVISTEVDRPRSVTAADLDGDGDLDALSASAGDGKIAWYENLDGLGNFGAQQIIALGNGASSVAAADLDGDGDLDALSASGADQKIAWYRNTDGKGTFGAQQVFTLADRASFVAAADLDGDGDLDVLFSSSGNIGWNKNTDGQGAFAPHQIITTEVDGTRSVVSADVDGDGDLDVLSASFNDHKIAWYENTDGQGTFGSQQAITTPAPGALSVATTDVDRDGDLDVLAALLFDRKIAWYENTDGNGSFGPQKVVARGEFGPTSLAVADVDGDGDPDVLFASFDRIAWHEQRLLADSNDDGLFDSSDLVRVFQAGEYEDRIVGNSTFDEGDWNGDGEFDSTDLVLAFQAGHYERDGQPSLADLAAAVDRLFANDGGGRFGRAFIA